MRIITQAPTRISLFGGGTDVDPYASKFGGVCFNMGINIRQRFVLDDTKLDLSNKWIEGDSMDFVKNLIKPFTLSNIVIEHYFDGITQSGLGSSASAAVALIGGINRLRGIKMTKEEIAEKAWDIEVNKIGMYSGKQDQYCSVFGGVNLMEFKDKVTVTPLSPAFVSKITPLMILFYSGRNRKSGIIQEGFKQLSDDQIDKLNNIKRLCYDGVKAISQNETEKVGQILDEIWEFKKQSNKGVSNERIDTIYQTAKSAGAWGGKILGAGGGGHILFMCPVEKQENLKNELSKHGCKWVDFSIDWNGLETRII